MDYILYSDNLKNFSDVLKEDVNSANDCFEKIGEGMPFIAEDLKMLPISDVRAEYCRICGVPSDGYYDEIEEYEKTVLANRT